jgi:hypothetical protein
MTITGIANNPAEKPRLWRMSAAAEEKKYAVEKEL